MKKEASEKYSRPQLLKPLSENTATHSQHFCNTSELQHICTLNAKSNTYC